MTCFHVNEIAVSNSYVRKSEYTVYFSTVRLFLTSLIRLFDRRLINITRPRNPTLRKINLTIQLSTVVVVNGEAKFTRLSCFVCNLLSKVNSTSLKLKVTCILVHFHAENDEFYVECFHKKRLGVREKCGETSLHDPSPVQMHN